MSEVTEVEKITSVTSDSTGPN